MRTGDGHLRHLFALYGEARRPESQDHEAAGRALAEEDPCDFVRFCNSIRPIDQ